MLDPEPTSRAVFWFHRPETLGGWLDEVPRYSTDPTHRHGLARSADNGQTETHMHP